MKKSLRQNITFKLYKEENLIILTISHPLMFSVSLVIDLEESYRIFRVTWLK